MNDTSTLVLSIHRRIPTAAYDKLLVVSIKQGLARIMLICVSFVIR